MNFARLYFATEPNFGLREHPEFPDGYKLVATVKSDSRDHIFSLCNSIDGPWWENTECELLGSDGIRSMSVGDIVVLPDKSVWRVEMAGWTDLGKANELGLGL